LCSSRTELNRMFACIRRWQIISANKKFSFQPLLERDLTIPHPLTLPPSQLVLMQKFLMAECNFCHPKHWIQASAISDHININIQEWKKIHITYSTYSVLLALVTGMLLPCGFNSLSDIYQQTSIMCLIEKTEHTFPSHICSTSNSYKQVLDKKKQDKWIIHGYWLTWDNNNKVLPVK